MLTAAVMAVISAGDEDSDDENDNDKDGREGDQAEPMSDVLGYRVTVGHQLADPGSHEHEHDRYARHAQGVTDQGDDAEVGAGLSRAQEHPGAEHGCDQGGDPDVKGRVVAGDGVVLHALAAPAPSVGQAQDEEHRARDYQRN